MQICASLTILCEPFLPFTAEKLQKMLRLGKTEWKLAGSSDLLNAGHEIDVPTLLFDRIEDKEIDYQIQKLLKTRKDNEQIQPQTPFKPPITYEDFARLDIRTATIMSAEKVAKTKKLLKLELTTGLDTRTVVSGISGVYEPADIVGKKVILLANLEPKNIRGIMSHGMILMAEKQDGDISFIAPDKDFPNGEIIC